jgi:hypothetical protein
MTKDKKVTKQIKEDSIEKAVEAFEEAPTVNQGINDMFDVLEMEEVEEKINE